MNWEFGNNLNWDLVKRQTYYPDALTKYNLPKAIREFPIPTITLVVDSYILLVGCRNPQAKPNWFLAGYCGARLLFSPSSTSDFISAVESYPRIKLGLNRLTLVRFKDFNLLPYLLEINIARWHQEMFIEVWKYSGAIGDEHISQAP